MTHAFKRFESLNKFFPRFIAFLLVLALTLDSTPILRDSGTPTHIVFSQQACQYGSQALAARAAGADFYGFSPHYHEALIRSTPKLTLHWTVPVAFLVAGSLLTHLAFSAQIPPSIPNPFPLRDVKRLRDKAASAMMDFILEEDDLPYVQVRQNKISHGRIRSLARQALRPKGQQEFTTVQEVDDPRISVRVKNVNELQDNKVQMSMVIASRPDGAQVSEDQSPWTAFRTFHYYHDHYYEILDAEYRPGKVLARLEGQYLIDHGFSLKLAPGETQILLVRDIGPVSAWGLPSQHVLSLEGAVTASKSFIDPPYRYDWVRDGALLIKSLIHMLRFLGRFNPLRFRLKQKIHAALSFMLTRIDQAAREGRLGDAKWQVNGERYKGKWGNPQLDGAPLTVTTLVDYATVLFEQTSETKAREQIETDIWPRVVTLLTYTVDCVKTRRVSFDLWEEMEGYHLYTRLAQYRGLTKGLELARRLGREEPADWREARDQIQQTILAEHVKSLDDAITELREQGLAEWEDLQHYRDDHGSGRQLILVSTLHEVDGRVLTLRVTDSAVLGAIVHNMEEDANTERFLPADDPAVLNTLFMQESLFKHHFPINGERYRTHPYGMGIGRYLRDHYDGHAVQSHGNPWPLTTAWFGRMYFYMGRSFSERGELPPDLSLEEIHNRALGYVHWIWHYTQKTKFMSEQIDHLTGRATGAMPLAWTWREWNRLLNDWLRSEESKPSSMGAGSSSDGNEPASSGVPSPPKGDLLKVSHKFRQAA